MSNKPKIVVDNPETLSALIRDMGGTVIPGDRFLFDLPLAKVRDVIPVINDLGIQVIKESERIERDETRARYTPQTVARLSLRYREE